MRPQAGSRIGTGHGEPPEDQSGANLDVPRAPVSDRTDEAGQPDEEQAHRDRLFGVEREHVDEDRHGQNRPAAAERPQETPISPANASATPLIIASPQRHVPQRAWTTDPERSPGATPSRTWGSAAGVTVGACCGQPALCGCAGRAGVHNLLFNYTVI